MDSKIIKFSLIFFFIFFKTNATEFKGKFIQGHFILGKTIPNAYVKIDNKPVKVSGEGYFVFGIDRDRKYDITIIIKNSVSEEKIVKKVVKRKYKIQRIDGLDEKKVTPPEEVYKRIKDENKKIQEISIGVTIESIDNNMPPKRTDIYIASPPPSATSPLCFFLNPSGLSINLKYLADTTTEKQHKSAIKNSSK